MLNPPLVFTIFFGRSPITIAFTDLFFSFLCLYKLDGFSDLKKAYRWHSAISERDERWTENLQRQLFGKTANEVSLGEFMQALSVWEHELPRDPHERDFVGLTRNADGKFDDDVLVKILTESIEDTAGMFSPRNPLAKLGSLIQVHLAPTTSPFVSKQSPSWEWNKVANGIWARLTSFASSSASSHTRHSRTSIQVILQGRVLKCSLRCCQIHMSRISCATYMNTPILLRCTPGWSRKAQRLQWSPVLA